MLEAKSDLGGVAAMLHTRLTTQNVTFSYKPLEDVFKTTNSELFGVAVPDLKRSAAVEIRSVNVATRLRYNMPDPLFYMVFRAVWKVRSSAAGSKAVSEVFELVRKSHKKPEYHPATIVCFEKDGKTKAEERQINGCNIHGVEMIVDRSRNSLAVHVHMNGLFQAPY
ncbi:MAG: hypothetical protein AAFQ08_02305 [Bacteroidota bacterium]